MWPFCFFVVVSSIALLPGPFVTSAGQLVNLCGGYSEEYVGAVSGSVYTAVITETWTSRDSSLKDRTHRQDWLAEAVLYQDNVTLSWYSTASAIQSPAVGIVGGSRHSVMCMSSPRTGRGERERFARDLGRRETAIWSCTNTSTCSWGLLWEDS